MNSSTEPVTILGTDGAPIKSKPKEAPKLPRAERRRMMRDKDRHNKTIAVTAGVPPYYRLLAYGQVLISQMVDIQQRMGGIGYTPKKFRAARQEALTAEWNETVEKLEEVQKDIEIIEQVQAFNEDPSKEVDVYGLC